MAKIYHERHAELSVFRVVGAPTVDELIAAVTEYGKEVTQNIIYDFSIAQLTEISQANFNSFVLAAIARMPNRTAGKTILVASTDVNFGLCRMYTTIPLQADTHNKFLVSRCFDEAMKLAE